MPEDSAADTGGRRVFAVDLEGPRVTLRRLSKTAQTALSLLREIDSEVSQKPGGGLEWIVSGLSTGSVHLEASPELHDPSLGTDHASRVLDAVGAGLETVEHSSRRPEHFSDSALEQARELTRALEEEGITALRVRSNGSRVELTRRLAGNVDDLIAGKVRSIGSVEGRLETVALHGRAYFNVYDAISGAAVKCYFTDEMLEEVRDALGHRVLVYGTLYSRRTGETAHLQASEIEVLPEEDELAPVESMRGLLSDG